MTLSALTPSFHFVPETESTNRLAKAHAEGGARAGCVVVAERQTAGRGSGDRKWHSPPGGLYASILLRYAPENPVTQFSILAAVAIACALKDVVKPPNSIGVKWPNDCLLNGKKVAGVLCEVLPEKGFVIVGIGINVNLDAEALCPFQSNVFSATSLWLETGQNFDVKDLVYRVVAQVFDGFHQLGGEGFVGLQLKWERLCPFVGEAVSVRDRYEKECNWQPEVIQRGVFLGIDESGAAVVSTEGGMRKRIVSGEMVCC